MPIYKSYIPNSFTRVKVWKISESYQELLSSIDLSKNTIEKLNKVQSDVGKREILSIRHLLNEFGFSSLVIVMNNMAELVSKYKK